MLPKGSLEILAELEKRPRHFGELAKIRVHSKPVNRRTFVSRLKMLEREGLIARVVESTWPPHVEYSLTEKGKALLTLLRE